MVNTIADSVELSFMRNGGKKACLNHILWKFAGFFFPPFMKKKKFSSVRRVVFVCKGNICRSPIAEHAFRRASDLECCSAGLDTTIGHPADARVRVIARECNLDLSGHKTTPVSDIKFTPHDLVVCMEPSHYFQFRKLNKNIRVVLLGCYGIPRKVYIHDPYGASDEYAKSCVNFLVDSVGAFSKVVVEGSVG